MRYALGLTETAVCPACRSFVPLEMSETEPSSIDEAEAENTNCTAVPVDDSGSIDRPESQPLTCVLCARKRISLCRSI